MNVEILRTTGAREHHTVDGRDLHPIEQLMDSDCFDFVRLADGVHVMLVDDNGIAKRKPVNPAATALYHAVCRPGTTHQIVGDVAIVRAVDLD